VLTIVKAWFVGYTIAMKTPDQNNLPPNKNKAEQIKQQPAIDKKTIKGILAGIGSLPVIRSIGEKMKSPKIDRTKSNEAREQLNNQQKDYDSLILSKTNELFGGGLDNDAYDAKLTEIEKLEFEKQKSKNESELNIKNQSRSEVTNFAKENPDKVEKVLTQKSKNKLKDLNDQFKSAENEGERDSIKAQIEAENNKLSKNIAKLSEYKAENEKQKIEAKGKSKADKIKDKSQRGIDKFEDKINRENELKDLDEKALNIVRQTLKDSRDTDAKKNKQQSIIEAKEIEQSKKERQKRLKGLGKEIIANETKWDNEVEAKKDHVSIFDKLKSSVKGASKKSFEALKSKIKDNDEAKLNPKPKEFNSKKQDRVFVSGPAGLEEKISNKQSTVSKAIEKIKSVTKKGFEAAQLEIKKNDEAKLNPKPKEKKSSNFDMSSVMAKTNLFGKSKNVDSKDGNSHFSPEIQNLKAKSQKSQNDLDFAKKEFKKMEKEMKAIAKQGTDSAEYNNMDQNLRKMNSFINEINLEIKITEAEIFAQQNLEEVRSSPESIARSEKAENNAKTQKQIQTLTIEHEQEKKKLNILITKFNKSKDTKGYEKVRTKMKKLDEKFNQKIETLRSNLED
jgi:hypothetical protein